MKSKQVLSIDQMKYLRELGLDTSDASMHWQFLPTVESFFNGVLALEERPTLFVSQPNMKYEYPAYTLQDILDKLPPVIKKYFCLSIRVSEYKKMWHVEYEGAGCLLSYFHLKNLIDAAYEMLCWCVENGYIGKEGEICRTKFF